MTTRKNSFLDTALGLNTNAPEETSDGLFSAVVDKAKDGRTFPMVKVQDSRVPWRFAKVHPVMLALILDNPAEAAKALAALPALQKRVLKQG